VGITPAPVESDGGWFVAHGPHNVGPMPLKQLQAGLRSGRFAAGAQVWRSGLPTWRNAADVLNEPPAAGPAPTAPIHPAARLVLILGVIALALIPPVGIAALVVGGRARRDVRNGFYSASGALAAGWSLGLIAVVMTALILVALVAGLAMLLVFGAAAA
jgi:hypothetical protein